MRSMLWESDRRVVLCGLVAVLATFFGSGGAASASILGAPETRNWSDLMLSLPGGVSVSFNEVTNLLAISAVEATGDLEIGGQFGPGGVDVHYGTGGTLGGPFSATLSVSGVEIDPTDGSVIDGGTLSIELRGFALGGIGTDYGIGVGGILLEGEVIEVSLMSNRLEVLFSISGGALQTATNLEDPSIGVFSPINLGILRFGSPSFPADFSASFTVTSTLDVLGAPIPEASITTFVFFSGILAWVCGSRRCLSFRSMDVTHSTPS